MQIQFIKNIQFTRLVKANGHLREFNFRRLNGAPEEIFTVDVSDDRGNRIMFRMKKHNAAWKIEGDLIPEWVYENEGAFNDLIEEELHNA